MTLRVPKFKALECLGSAQCRDIEYRDSWVLIGVKGATIGTVPEKRVPQFMGYADIQVNYPELMATEGYRFVYQDQIGSTRRLSNSDMTRDYTPFGETLAGAGSGKPGIQPVHLLRQ